jgi:hypothetical protein
VEARSRDREQQAQRAIAKKSDGFYAQTTGFVLFRNNRGRFYWAKCLIGPSLFSASGWLGLVDFFLLLFAR